MYSHLKLCLAAVTHNLKWVKTTPICLIQDQQIANVDVYSQLQQLIAVIGNKHQPYLPAYKSHWGISRTRLKIS